jgi:hypothetical protein
LCSSGIGGSESEKVDAHIGARLGYHCREHLFRRGFRILCARGAENERALATRRELTSMGLRDFDPANPEHRILYQKGVSLAQADELAIAMNRAAEQAEPEAKA